MAVARRLKQRRRGEFALLRRAAGEPCFGVQLAGNQPDEMAWAAMLAEGRGADFVDVAVYGLLLLILVVRPTGLLVGPPGGQARA